jgi:hypothetical protein
VGARPERASRAGPRPTWARPPSSASPSRSSPRSKKDGTRGPSRLPELEGAGVPVLVVQGQSDRFGMPPEGPGRRVVVVAGDHGLKKDLNAVGAAVRDWLNEVKGAIG